MSREAAALGQLLVGPLGNCSPFFPCEVRSEVGLCCAASGHSLEPSGEQALEPGRLDPTPGPSADPCVVISGQPTATVTELLTPAQRRCLSGM